MKVLITGGAGSIGSHLTEALLWRGDEVVVLDDLSGSSKEGLRYVEGFTGLSFVEGSSLDEKLVERLVGSVDSIVHLAGAGASLDARARLETNIQGAVNVLGAAAAHSRPTAMVPSQEWTSSTGSKAEEKLAVRVAQKWGLPFTITRIHNVISPREAEGNKTLLSHFMRERCPDHLWVGKGRSEHRQGHPGCRNRNAVSELGFESRWSISDGSPPWSASSDVLIRILLEMCSARATEPHRSQRRRGTGGGGDALLRRRSGVGSEDQVSAGIAPPTISVVMPVDNEEKLIAEAIRRVPSGLRIRADRGGRRLHRWDACRAGEGARPDRSPCVAAKEPRAGRSALQGRVSATSRVLTSCSKTPI